MPHLDHLLRALSISIPLGIVFGLFAGYLRKRLGQSLADKYACKWELLRRSIYAVGIFMFGVLAFYCFNVLKHTTFGSIYLLMSVLNGICLIRSFSRKHYDANGVHRKYQREPKRILPSAEVQARV